MDIVTLLLFLVGFVVLIQGAEWLIDGGSLLARKVGISDLVVGLTIVAFGTSLPELIVNLYAGAESPELAIGNILGSNIANILLILGVASLIYPLRVQRQMVYREIIFNVMAAGMLGVLVAERFLTEGGFDGLDRIDGIILISYFIVFLYYIFGRSSSSKPSKDVKEEQFNVGATFIRIFGGAAGLFFGGQWIKDGAIDIASSLGVSEALIGVTVVAIATSLPELAASIIAVRKKNVDIAVGNAVGSNLFNIFWVLGVSAYFNPLPFDDKLFTDVLIMIAVALILFGTMVFGRPKHQISKREGTIFLILYASYMVYAIARG